MLVWEINRSYYNWSPEEQGFASQPAGKGSEEKLSGQDNLGIFYYNAIKLGNNPNKNTYREMQQLEKKEKQAPESKKNKWN